MKRNHNLKNLFSVVFQIMAKKAKAGKKAGGKKGGKKGGTKTPTLVDGVSAEEMTPEQLVEHIGRIKEEVRKLEYKHTCILHL
jgi:hypothetical protein